MNIIDSVQIKYSLFFNNLKILPVILVLCVAPRQYLPLWSKICENERQRIICFFWYFINLKTYGQFQTYTKIETILLKAPTYLYTVFQ